MNLRPLGPEAVLPLPPKRRQKLLQPQHNARVSLSQALARRPRSFYNIAVWFRQKRYENGKTTPHRPPSACASASRPTTSASTAFSHDLNQPLQRHPRRQPHQDKICAPGTATFRGLIRTSMVLGAFGPGLILPRSEKSSSTICGRASLAPGGRNCAVASPVM